MRLLPVLLTIFLLFGCEGKRLSKEQTQDLSDAQAASYALMIRISNGWAQIDPHTRDLIRACTGFLFSATVNIEGLPPARIGDPAVLASSATKAAEAGDAGDKAREKPSPGFSWGVWGLIGGCSAFAAHFGLRLAGGLPGIGGLVARLVEKAWDAYAPEDLKKRDDKMRTVAQHAIAYGHAVTQIASADPKLLQIVESVKDRAEVLSKKLGIDGEIGEILADAKLRASQASLASSTETQK